MMGSKDKARSCIASSSFRLERSSGTTFVIDTTVGTGEARALRGEAKALTRLSRVGGLTVISAAASVILSDKGRFRAIIFAGDSTIAIAVPSSSACSRAVKARVIYVRTKAKRISVRKRSSTAVGKMSDISAGNRCFNVLLVGATTGA